jgi:hypothetical protein
MLILILLGCSCNKVVFVLYHACSVTVHKAAADVIKCMVQTRFLLIFYVLFTSSPSRPGDDPPPRFPTKKKEIPVTESPLLQNPGCTNTISNEITQESKTSTWITLRLYQNANNMQHQCNEEKIVPTTGLFP